VGTSSAAATASTPCWDSGEWARVRARDLKLDQEIALKRIRPDRVSPERRETLRREIILSRKVTHESVCRVYDLVEIEGEEFVSMEYLAGKTLKEIEEKERMLPLGRGLAIAKGISARCGARRSACCTGT
jgi:serine/threonine protein kinase